MSHEADLEDPSNEDKQGAQDLFQKIITGRKSYRTLKGNTERVWPPKLEAALIDGLENYQPDNTLETKYLRRFPLRNRFISDYIFTATGIRRTPKQVGSRLQQIRDTCGNPVLKLLLHTHEDSDSSSSIPSPSTRSPSGPADLDGLALHDGPRSSGAGSTSSRFSMTVLIDILPVWSCPPGFDPASEISLPDRPLASLRIPEDSHVEGNIFRPSSYPRSLWDIDPTLTFTSTSAISARSIFTVFVNEAAVYWEDTELVFVKTPPEDGDTQLYSTQLVPGYWETICQSPDPRQFIIVQDVVSDPTRQSSPPSGLINPSMASDSSVLFSATYKFIYPDEISSHSSAAPSLASPDSTSDKDHHLYAFSHSTPLSRSAIDPTPESPPCGEPGPSCHQYDQLESSYMRRSRPTELYTGATSDPRERHNITTSPSSCFPSELSNYVGSPSKHHF